MFDPVRFDIEQLTAMARVDNFLMKYGNTFRISNMEVYDNGCINVFIKHRGLGTVTYYALIRPSKQEQEHYDQLAREHGQAD